jgi:mycothiol synthase
MQWTRRGYRDELDLAAIVAAYNECFAFDHSEEEIYTIEGQRSRYVPVDDFDPARDVFIVEADGELVASGRLYLRSRDGVRNFMHLGCVRPAWRGRGIGTALLRAKEQRMREIITTRHERVPYSARTFAADSEPQFESLLQANGYNAVRRHYHMQRPLSGELPAAPVPSGLEVRSVRADQLRAIWDAKQESFRDHWEAFPATEWRYQNFVDDPDRDVTLWRVAWDGDEIAGLALGAIHFAENERYQRQQGWLEQVAVRRPWRKRGLARALMLLVMRELQARGMAQAVLDVDAENLTGALRLYEQMGFRTVKHWTFYDKALQE